jgi:hypothetical protein
MKRSIKRNSGIYSFLDNSSLLENGSSEAIEQAKRKYWRDFRREYKKARRHEYKSFEIPFTPKELNIIIKEAERNHTSPTNYIKQSALGNKKKIVDPVTIGEIRELLILHHNSLKTLTEENQLHELTADQVLNQVTLIETRVFDFFSSFK